MKKARFFSTTLVLLLPFLFPPPVRGEGSEFGDPVHGQALFQEKGCVRCHAVRGAGGRIGPDLGRKAVRNSFFQIIAGMWNHSQAMDQKMAEFRLTRSYFEGSELTDLVSFLYFLNYFDEPGDPEIGRTLFTQKHCIECHKTGGEGGGVGPALDDLARGEPPLRIAQALWNHGGEMISEMEARGLEVPHFQNNEIVDLFAFLRRGGTRLVGREFQSAGDPDRGERLFDLKGCRRCHAIFGVGEDLGPDLGRVELRGSVTQVAGRMWNHWPTMAEAMEGMGMRSPEFEQDDLADLFAFMFIARFDGLPGEPGRGREVFNSKKCSLCHGPQERKGIGPSLEQIVARKDKNVIVQSMWNHAPRMGDRMADLKIPWPRFEGGELADLFAFFEAEWSKETHGENGK